MLIFRVRQTDTFSLYMEVLIFWDKHIFKGHSLRKRSFFVTLFRYSLGVPTELLGTAWEIDHFSLHFFVTHWGLQLTFSAQLEKVIIFRYTFSLPNSVIRRVRHQICDIFFTKCVDSSKSSPNFVMNFSQKLSPIILNPLALPLQNQVDVKPRFWS